MSLIYTSMESSNALAGSCNRARRTHHFLPFVCALYALNYDDTDVGAADGDATGVFVAGACCGAAAVAMNLVVLTLEEVTSESPLVAASEMPRSCMYSRNNCNIT